MLDTDTKRRIDTARDLLVGKVPDPKSQVEQITIALIYKFMDDMDAEAEELGGKRKFFSGDFARYGWARLMQPGIGGHELLALYADGIAKMPENPGIPPLFRDIFKNAYLPYRDPETLKSFLKVINDFTYDHSERLGDAFEYLLSVLGSQGDAGQFRTPRHIIDFIVDILAPRTDERILDPACGTAGFLISAYKYILRNNSSKYTPSPLSPLPEGEGSSAKDSHYRGGFDFSGLTQRAKELRRTETNAEKLLWELLRDRQLCEAKFRRQHQFGEYICDFYCDASRLVVECDGGVHDGGEQRTHDQRRDAWLKSRGLTILRFANHRILSDTESVLEDIAAHLSPSPSGRGQGEGKITIPGDLLTPEQRGAMARNFQGYDISPDMVRLSLVNLYLHGFTDPHIFEYDTLTDTARWNEQADVILANPPFMSPKGGIRPHNRFSIQAKRSEVLFVDYIAEHLGVNGRAGIIVPEGIIFQSQNAYKDLRRMLVENSLIAVISLPAGCFNPYSGVKTSILLLDKSLARKSNTVAFFKVENDGYDLGAQRRPIQKNDLPTVRAELDSYLQALRRGEPSPAGRGQGEGSAGLIVPKEKIATNGDYNLSGERYRESKGASNAFTLCAIGEIADEIKAGFASGKSSVDTEGVPHIRPMNITDKGQFTWTGLKQIDRAEYAGREDYALRSGDVLFNNTNSKELVGKTCLIEEAIEGGFSNHMTRIRVKTEVCIPAFLAFVLHNAWQKGIFLDLANKWVGQAGINATALARLQIPLPPLEMQREIVAEIEGYQKEIKRLESAIQDERTKIQTAISRIWGE
jgi:type I restriction-modification system DNA methylase subunit/very-short-patch-repair endonuclease